MTKENIIYGFHSAEEAIQNQPKRINQIWTATGHRSTRLKKLLDAAHDQRIPIKIAEKGALTRLAGNAHHQGIVLEISPYSYFDADAILDDLKDQSVFCILDEIQDATNLGTLIRTMEGAGVEGIFLPARRSASVTAATHRLSAGALEHVRIARVVNLANLIEKMHTKGIRVICADTTARKVWYEADFAGPIAILLGNESRGVRRLLKEKSEDLVRIPMLGKVKSLNVNVAAAILLYEAARQRGRR